MSLRRSQKARGANFSTHSSSVMSSEVDSFLNIHKRLILSMEIESILLVRHIQNCWIIDCFGKFFQFLISSNIASLQIDIFSIPVECSFPSSHQQILSINLFSFHYSMKTKIMIIRSKTISLSDRYYFETFIIIIAY